MKCLFLNKISLFAGIIAIGATINSASVFGMPDAGEVDNIVDFLSGDRAAKTLNKREALKTRQAALSEKERELRREEEIFRADMQQQYGRIDNLGIPLDLIPSERMAEFSTALQRLRAIAIKRRDTFEQLQNLSPRISQLQRDFGFFTNGTLFKKWWRLATCIVTPREGHVLSNIMAIKRPGDAEDTLLSYLGSNSPTKLLEAVRRIILQWNYQQYQDVKDSLTQKLLGCFEVRADAWDATMQEMLQWKQEFMERFPVVVAAYEREVHELDQIMKSRDSLVSRYGDSQPSIAASDRIFVQTFAGDEFSRLGIGIVITGASAFKVAPVPIESLLLEIKDAFATKASKKRQEVEEATTMHSIFIAINNTFDLVDKLISKAGKVS